jgi:hypothetical protein
VMNDAPSAYLMNLPTPLFPLHRDVAFELCFLIPYPHRVDK